MRFLLAAVVAVLVMALLPVAQAPRAAAQGDNPVQLDVTNVTPSVVADGGPGEVVITGRLTNTSDNQIDDIEARVQRGDSTTTEPAVQRAMRSATPTVTEPAFSPVADGLAPGQQIPVELRIPLTGPNSLQLTQPGVYPLLVNVNGVQAVGGRARIAESRFLLPVLSTPGNPVPPPPRPTDVSMLVPIVDYPRLEREALPGMRPVLVDDALSTSLAPGGRLYELLQAVTESAPSGSPLGSALCFAIDPDLLITVRAMQGPYQVRQPNNTLTEGIGTGAANLWLSKLREATSGRCVIALPYADADVAALARAGLPDLVNIAMDGAKLLEDKSLLGVEPRSVLWPVEGALADPESGNLPRTVLMEPQSLSTPAGSLDPVKVRGQDMTAVPIDPLLTSALDPERDTPHKTTALSPPVGQLESAQNALGALTFRATRGSVGDATSVLVPPRRWNLRGDDLRSLLDGMQHLTDAGLVQPRALPEPAPAGLPEADLNYPVEAGASEIPQPVLKDLAAENFKVGDLYRSSRRDPSTDVEPSRITTPLVNGLLRGASSAWRGQPGAAEHWVDLGRDTIQAILAKVDIEESQTPLAGASPDSPTPLVVVNELPITVAVVFRIPPVPGVQVQDDFGDVATIPANGRRGFWLQTTAQRAGTFTLDVQMTTEAGTQLGSTKRLSYKSGNYGPFILVITLSAAALLVLMSARRILKRLRARQRRQAAEQSGEPPAEEAPETAQIATTEGDRNPS
ncbi:glycoprotein [Saccharopolyspora sp. NPDC000359]|uniref:glycoprotein n=1 Tax=Saccharopolyspora sp. NPDC000359 TaxID=3154251 RepID=UPI00332348F4